MAVFYPPIETIKKFKVPPTKAERDVLNFLYKNLDNSFEIYFHPYLNGDRPDIIIMRKNYGVMIIEVKDWNVNDFSVISLREWSRYIGFKDGKPDYVTVKSPMIQAKSYKNNLYNLHVQELLEMKINNLQTFNIVCCAVYFHNSTSADIKSFLKINTGETNKIITKDGVDLIGSDALTDENFKTLLEQRYLMTKAPSKLFTDSLYKNFRRILAPAMHLKTQGQSFHYSAKQKDIIFSQKLEQRVRGVFGSGKTTVLVARAVQAYKRALKRNAHPRILILTYNITLKNYILDKLKQVDEEFPLENFVIINYHQFIKAELNNIGINIEKPKELGSDSFTTNMEKKFYGNIDLFEQYKDRIAKYDAVFIDEIQDFHRAWMDIIKNYFRDPEGDYVLFGDVKQNIYGQPTEKKDVVTNVSGVKELQDCYRSDLKVKELAQSYQKAVFRDKYDIDDFSDSLKETFFGQQMKKEGHVSYIYLQEHNTIEPLYHIIREQITSQEANVSPNDITILMLNSKTLRWFDAYYRYRSREKTKSMVETIESMYLTHLNCIKIPNSPKFIWSPITEDMFKRYTYTTVKQRIAVLSTIYDLYVSFGDTFKDRLSEVCNRFGITLDKFLEFQESNKKDLYKFKTEVYHGNYDVISNNKKLHFFMNSGTIKLSTIHSFKGWESEVVFLVIEPNHNSLSLDEVLYTGLTRCKRDLFIINVGNDKYNEMIAPLVKHIQ